MCVSNNCVVLEKYNAWEGREGVDGTHRCAFHCANKKNSETAKQQKHSAKKKKVLTGRDRWGKGKRETKRIGRSAVSCMLARNSTTGAGAAGARGGTE